MDSVFRNFTTDNRASGPEGSSLSSLSLTPSSDNVTSSGLPLPSLALFTQATQVLADQMSPNIRRWQKGPGPWASDPALPLSSHVALALSSLHDSEDAPQSLMSLQFRTALRCVQPCANGSCNHGS